MRLSPPKMALVVLIAYWIAIFILTHIPIIHISFLVRQVNASDKSLHFIAYFLLAFLLWLAFNPSQKVEWQKTSVWWSLFVIVCYGAMDELLQTYMARSSSIFDFIADISGAISALILLSIFSYRSAQIIVTMMTIFAIRNITVVNFNILFPQFSMIFHLFGYGFLSWLCARHIYQSTTFKINKLLQIILLISGPCIFLCITECTAAIIGRTLQISDIIISVFSILTVSLLYIFVLNREKQLG